MTDRATVHLVTKPANSTGLLLMPGKNLRDGTKDFRANFPDPTSLEEDLLLLAASIYACDLAFKRGARENITRTIHLTIPVTNNQAFARLHDELEHILYVLSHDNWIIEFTRRTGTPERARTWPGRNGTTLLFSGGLDSLAGAVDLLDQHGPSHLQLASHVTGNHLTRNTQETLLAYLQTKYGVSLRRIAVRTGGITHKDFPFPADHNREETQRTRSFMFLTIAALAARRSGHHDVVMIAENGQMAIHLPLSAARIGAFSTHTAHPEFVHNAQAYFSTLLDHQFTITNPYVYRTKAEVVSTLARNHTEAIPQSVSCWRGSRVATSNHCGECVPCLVRRVALESNGLRLKEYARDLLTEDIAALATDDEGKRNFVELVEFATAFQAFTNAALDVHYPDLFSSYFAKDAATAMYRRFAAEALTTFQRYPGTRPLLPRGPATKKRNALE